MHRNVNSFESALNSKSFVVTSEVLLGPQSGKQHVLEHAELFRGLVDAVLATDNQSGRLHASSLATAIILQQAGVEPILQLGCRNRNRVALLGDFLGASLFGIRSIQVVRGERVPEGFKPRPKPELDVTATEMIEIAGKMKTGDSFAEIPDLFVGGVTSPRAPARNWPAKKLVEKIDAGANFILVHTCMDIDMIRAYFRHLVDLKLTHRSRFIVSLAVLSSRQDAQWLRENKPNTVLPKALLDRLGSGPKSRDEGIAIAAEMLTECVRIPGVSGAHVYAPTDLTTIPEVLRRAGLVA